MNSQIAATETLPHLFSKLMLLFFLCFWLVSDLLAGTDVYVTRDADGNPVFSDQPSKTSEKIQVQEVMTIPAEKIPDVPQPDKQEKAFAYQELQIVNPLNDSAVRENSGSVSISVSVKPALKPGHKIVMTLDGQEISRGSSSTASLSNVDRGTHTVAASIIAADGSSLIAAQPIQFTLLRVSQ